MKKQKIDTLEFDNNGDILSVEAFISLPEALAVEEQRAMIALQDLFRRLQVSNLLVADKV